MHLMDVDRVIHMVEAGCSSQDDVLCVIDQWLLLCDRAEAVAEGCDYTEMHVIGLGVCALLHAMPDDESMTDST